MVFGAAFALETVHAVHIVGLVVTAVQEEGIGIQPLVCIQGQGDFGGPGASVDKVAVEEVVVFLGRFASEAEDFQEVEELA